MIKSKRETIVEAQLVTAYEVATTDDKANVAKLIERAINSKRDVAIYEITPGMAAILFFDHNKQNRPWDCSTSIEYARQVKDKEWEFTNQGIGFLISGNVGDGQTRLGGIALSGLPVEVSLTFGMTEESIIVIDTGRRRSAADYAGILTQDTAAKRKEQMVKKAYGALAKDKDEEAGRRYVLKSNRDCHRAMMLHNHLLEKAIEIGDSSVVGRSKPTFTAADMSAFAFLLLLKGWPTDRLIADIDVFQSGEDREGGNSPLFVAADQLQKDAVKRERASVTARFGAASKAFLLHEQGVKAVRVSEIRAAMKPRQWVDPSYPQIAA